MLSCRDTGAACLSSLRSISDGRDMTFPGGKGRRALAAFLAMIALGFAIPAHAQSATNDATAESQDAFGNQVGLESTGTYTEFDARGFSPLDAGNSRIEGIYFDQVWNLPSRLRRSTAIRVGFAAVDTPFVAPTGVVDQQLHPRPTEPGNTLIYNRYWYGGYFNEWEYRMPINDRFAVRGGIGFAKIGQSDGADGKSYAVTLRGFARIGDMELSPFYAFGENTRDEAKPLAIVSAGYLPKVPPARKYLGQDWAFATRDYRNTGATLKGAVIGDLSFRGGIFRSVSDRKTNFAEIYDIRAGGDQARHLVLADPAHDIRSTSGEGLFVWRSGSKGVSHRIFAGYRARNRVTETGGSQVFDFGLVPYGIRDLHPEPEFNFAEVNRGSVRQSSWMAAYVGAIEGLGQINLGLQKARYRASIRNGESGAVDRTRSDPWLYNASLLVELSPSLSAYVATQRGLEDSGIAPGNATNRDEQLQAVKSSQYEGGLRWDFGKVQLVLAAFQITKPYFSYDASRRFVVLGDQRHRGVEASLAGQLLDRLHVVAGAVVMDPVVTGPGREAGLVGSRPIAVRKVFARVDMNYRTDLPGNLVLTGSFEYRGRTRATAAPIAHLGGRQLTVDPFWYVDLGTRQTVRIGKTTIGVRMIVRDVFDKAGWFVTAADVVVPSLRRSLLVTVTADF